MRRPNRLQVNTFPFLAVLLCAMGALILILLIMDRRSRVAAQARGRDGARQRADEHDRALADRRREQAREQEVVTSAWNIKRARLKARLDAEQAALDAETRQVQARLAAIAHELRGEGDTLDKLRRHLQSEQTRLTRHERALKTAREEAATLKTKLTTADRARHRMAADLVGLERVIADLQAARKRDAMTYSVIPYKGKSGENRRPLYVECNGAGLLFHPDRVELPDPSIPALREEINRRVARIAEKRKQAGLKDERPYLMMLVRPEGIQRYYQVQSAIHDLPIEFGYEFVDADWVLTVPPEETPLAEGIVPPPVKPAPTEVVGTAVSRAGTNANGSAPVTQPGGPTGSSAAGILNGSPSDTTGATGPPLEGVALPAPAAGNPGGSGATGPGLVAKNPGPPALPELTLSAVAAPARGGAANADGSPPPAGIKLIAPPAGVEAPSPDPTPIRVPAALPGSIAASTSARGGPVVQGNGRPQRPAPEGPNVAGAQPRNLPLLPARVHGADESILFIECLSDGVIVHPGHRSISIDALNHSPAHNQLFQAVKGRLALHKGDPKRYQIRFLIHRDAERTFHLAYPVFNGLMVGKTRYNLQPDDDVSRLILGD